MRHKYRLNKHDKIICYDDDGFGLGIYTSARVAWTFKYFGMSNVRVLNGGFRKWMREDRRVEEDIMIKGHKRDEIVREEIKPEDVAESEYSMEKEYLGVTDLEEV